MAADFDIAVVGGGPAGSTAASYLAAAGLDVAVFESELFPRPHVGESLVPATTPVLSEIGVLDEIDAAGFPRKYGAAWTSAESRDVPRNGFMGLDHGWAAEITFVERDQPGVDRDYTYHVDRAEFDLILLKHAERRGARVFSGCRVLKVDFESDADTVGLHCRFGSRTVKFTARMVVDASGRHTMLGRQLRLKVPDPVFNQYAIHTWFKGLDRTALAVDPKKTDYIYVHFLPIEDSWVWQIPITDTITSVGVVTQKERFIAANTDRASFFWDFVSSRPELADGLRRAERLRDFKHEGDYSYSMKQICGDRFVMVGDAARFVDPIFSSGVSVALNSARLAAKDIIAASGKPDFSRQRFATFESKISRAVKHWYEFISIYYRLNVLFTAFVQDPRYRVDVLKMLQGDFYDDDEPKALQVMRDTVTEVESNPDHLWHPYLGNITALVDASGR